MSKYLFLLMLLVVATAGMSCRKDPDKVSRLGMEKVQAQVAAGDGEAALKAAGKCLGRLPEPQAMAFGQQVFGVLMSAGMKHEAAALPGVIEQRMKDSVGRKGLVFEIKLALAIDSGNLAEAQAHYRAAVGGVADANAINGFHALSKALPDGGEAFSEELMDLCARRTAVREEAARQWVRKSQVRGDIAGLSSRLVALQQKGFDDLFVSSQLESVYPVLLSPNNKKELEGVYVMCGTMLKNAKDAETKRRMGGYLLDIGFFIEKYKESLALLESGVFKGDPQLMNPMMISKVKAHVALQEGRVDDAVRCFREFMEAVGKQVEGREIDPLDSSWVTREMILGLNARRIGDILAKAGRTDEATKAYAEARQLYEKALRDFPDERSKERKKIQQALADIPKG